MLRKKKIYGLPLGKCFPAMFNEKAEGIEGGLQKSLLTLSPVPPTNAHITPLLHTYVPTTSLGHADLYLLTSQDLQIRQRDVYACPQPLWHFIVDICAKWADWAGLLSNVVWANWRSNGRRKSQLSHQPTLATSCLGIPKRGINEDNKQNTSKSLIFSFRVKEMNRYWYLLTVESIHLKEWI